MIIIRWILGSLILFFNWVFSPRSLKRDADLQATINEQTKSLTLSQYRACPFCVKVRRAMKRQSLGIETRDAARFNRAALANADPEAIEAADPNAGLNPE